MITRVDFSAKGVSTPGSRDQLASSGSRNFRASQSADIDLINMRIQQAKMAQMISLYYNQMQNHLSATGLPQPGLQQQAGYQYHKYNSLNNQTIQNGLTQGFARNYKNFTYAPLSSTSTNLSPGTVEDPKPVIPPPTLLRKVYNKLKEILWA